MRLNSVILSSNWIERKDDLPVRKVFVAWYNVIDENDNGTFYPSEFSSHLQIRYPDGRESLIHGHYGNNPKEVYEEYSKRSY